LGVGIVAMAGMLSCGVGTDEANSGSGHVHLNVMVDMVTAPAAYDVRIMGAAVNCTNVLNAPRGYEATEECTADQRGTSTTCYLAHVQVAPGSTSHLTDIPAGNVAVFVEGLATASDPTSIDGHGCTNVTITSGQTATAQVTVK
jgi:hypothetical protein